MKINENNTKIKYTQTLTRDAHNTWIKLYVHNTYSIFLFKLIGQTFLTLD